MAELPKDCEIVAYCRGPYSVLAVGAEQSLRARGFQAVRLDSSVVDWQAYGLAVNRGEAPADVRHISKESCL